MIKGLLWDDVDCVTKRARGHMMPPIPDTGWQRPSFFPDLSGADVIAIDCETYDPDLKKYGPGWARGVGHIVGISVAVDGGSWYFPIRHETETNWNFDPAIVLAWLQVELSRPHQMKVGANLTYDVGWLRHEGVYVQGFLFETQFAQALIDDKATVALDDMAERWLGIKKETNSLYHFIRAWFPQTPEGALRKHIHVCPPRVVGRYAEVDAEIPLKLWRSMWDRMNVLNVTNVFNMECKLIYMMIAMRFRGVRVDVNKAEEAQHKLSTLAASLHAEIKHSFGRQIKVGSEKDLSAVFEHLGLKVPGNFKKETLENYSHPLIEKILEIRKVEKLSGTFIGGYILGSNVNGRVHGQFHLMKGDDNGAIGGRMSSSTPNLQNLSSRDKIYAPIVRGCFVPDYGHLQWRKYDYSSIEYRGLASDAVGMGSEELRQQYWNDPQTDYHEIVRQMIYKVTGILLDRTPTKTINFGLAYGMGIAKLSRALKLSLAETKIMFESYHTGVPFVKSTFEYYAQMAQETGVVETVLGRRALFDEWGPLKFDASAQALPYEQAVIRYGAVSRSFTHKALNRRLQGSAADLMKMACLKCWESGVYDYTGVPLLIVHDEKDFSDPGGQDEAFRYMREVMETAVRLNVPVIADGEFGPNWGSVGVVKDKAGAVISGAERGDVPR
jgi:DNA polymerase I-like protein with 3'-5' exonuclease and polymerase domains